MSVDRILDSIASNDSVFNKAYDDIIHPAAENVGSAVGTLTSTLNVLLAPISWAVYGFNMIDKKVKIGLEDKLSRVPLENLSEPEANVVIPAYEALRYSLNKEELRNMYINLIAKSMNTDTKESVHPAFVEIIKQLSPLDAKVLDIICTNEINPLIDVNLFNKSTGAIRSSIQKNLTNILIADASKISLSIDNLERLKLINIPYDASYVNDALYEPIFNTEMFKSIEIAIEPHLNKFKLDIHKRYIFVTDLGKTFYNMCVVD